MPLVTAATGLTVDTADSCLLTKASVSTGYSLNSAATTNAGLIKAGSTSLLSLYAVNNGAASAFIKLFNKATIPVPGTDTPRMIVVVPAGGNVFITPDIDGFTFNLGLGVAVTNLIADLDTTVIVAGQVKVMAQYR